MTSMPVKQDEGFGFSLAEAKKRREEKDAREKWERDVERLAAELLIQHTAEELAVIAAQHIIYKEVIEALNVELEAVNTALQTENAMKLSAADLNAYVTRIAAMVKSGYASYRASKSGKKGHENRPQTADKAFVFECWKDWQKEPGRYRGKAKFAKDMLEKCESLKSQKKIEDWCREWEKLEPC